MTEAESQDGHEVSLFELGTTVVRNRWRIARWVFIGASVAALSVFSKPALYRASASFVPQGSLGSRSELASLAGQFGVSLPTGSQSFSPEFYADLLKTGVLLRPIARDTFVVQEMGGQRMSFLDLFEIPGAAMRREERGVKLLTRIVTATVVRSSRIVQLSVATEWPSVSLAVATALVSGVNEYNRRTMQGQAAAERRFIEDRLAVARAELREVEDRLERFLVTNRQFGSSPELTFERDRLQRDVLLHQQVFTSLTQSYEQVRIREVRDTPAITMFEPPSVPTLPEPRGRLKRILLGLVLGGFFGVLTAFTSEMMTRRKSEGVHEVEEFVGALGEVKGEILRPLRWFTRRNRL